MMAAQVLQRKLLITGGAGFIGSALIRTLLDQTDCVVCNVDKLTYAAAAGAVAAFEGHPCYRFVRQDISDAAAISRLMAEFQPDAIIHLAAESHVDRSIDLPAPFIQTNIVGTYTLLQAALEYWQGLSAAARARFRFHHVSTDEVFGPAAADERFDEDSPSRPISPYAASKASADHLVTSWHRTFGLPVLISNCTNNYGPFQFPEKLIPLAIVRAVNGQAIPVYGDGRQERDWLHVDDHVAGLMAVLAAGRVGQSYVLGSGEVSRNIDVVTALCRHLDDALPNSPHCPHEALISFVGDRPGHDARYAVDPSKARKELDWTPAIGLSDGLRDTVQWYLQNSDWWQPIMESTYDGRRMGRSRTTLAMNTGQD